MWACAFKTLIVFRLIYAFALRVDLTAKLFCGEWVRPSVCLRWSNTMRANVIQLWENFGGETWGPGARRVKQGVEKTRRGVWNVSRVWSRPGTEFRGFRVNAPRNQFVRTCHQGTNQPCAQGCAKSPLGVESLSSRKKDFSQGKQSANHRRPLFLWKRTEIINSDINGTTPNKTQCQLCKDWLDKLFPFPCFV